MATLLSPFRLGLTLAAATGLVAASTAIAVPASAAPPSLTFTITGGDGAGSGIVLGQPNGERTCSGEEGTESYTCSTPMGIVTSYSGSIAIRDGDGVNGTISVTCTVMYAGVTTAYWSQPSSSDATGSEDCDLYLKFDNGAEIWGGMHQTRILVDNFENSVFAFKFTRGSGKYSGFNSEFSMKDTQTWTPGPPMQEEKPTDGGDNPGPDPGTGSVIERLPGLIRAAFSRADDGGGASMPPITLKQKRTPIVDVTSMGLLAPTNEGSKVAVNAAAGSSCSGSLVAGKNRIVLPKKTVSAKGGSAVLKVLTGEELAAADEWTLTVTCTLKGKSSKYSKTVKTFEALPYTKGSGG